MQESGLLHLFYLCSGVKERGEYTVVYSVVMHYVIVFVVNVSSQAGRAETLSSIVAFVT